MLSAATIWEVSIKVGLGKLSLSLPFRQWPTKAMADLGVTVRRITVEDADAQAGLPIITVTRSTGLVAQARVENVPLVSNDVVFDQYGTSIVVADHREPWIR